MCSCFRAGIRRISDELDTHCRTTKRGYMIPLMSVFLHDSGGDYDRSGVTCPKTTTL
jgi:hypothetical protein